MSWINGLEKWRLDGFGRAGLPGRGQLVGLGAAGKKKLHLRENAFRNRPLPQIPVALIVVVEGHNPQAVVWFEEGQGAPVVTGLVGMNTQHQLAPRPEMVSPLHQDHPQLRGISPF